MKNDHLVIFHWGWEGTGVHGVMVGPKCKTFVLEYPPAITWTKTKLPLLCVRYNLYINCPPPFTKELSKISHTYQNNALQVGHDGGGPGDVVRWPGVGMVVYRVGWRGGVPRRHTNEDMDHPTLGQQST